MRTEACGRSSTRELPLESNSAAEARIQQRSTCSSLLLSAGTVSPRRALCLRCRPRRRLYCSLHRAARSMSPRRGSETGTCPTRLQMAHRRSCNAAGSARRRLARRNSKWRTTLCSFSSTAELSLSASPACTLCGWMVSAAAAAAVRLLVCLPVRLPVSVCVTVATATAATAADPHWMLRALATNGACNLCSWWRAVLAASPIYLERRSNPMPIGRHFAFMAPNTS